MYIPKPFVEDNLNVLHQWIHNHNFGVIFSQGEAGPMATHLPFVVDPKRGPYGTLVAHFARANPHWQALKNDTEALVVFQGAHAYVSSSWYAVDELVPTWNYAAVHAYGRPELVHDPEQLLSMVQALHHRHEAPISGQRDLSAHAERLLPQLKAIVGVEIKIEKIEGKAKFNQNRPRADQQGVVDALQDAADPLQREVAEIMKRNLNANDD